MLILHEDFLAFQSGADGDLTHTEYAVSNAMKQNQAADGV